MNWKDYFIFQQEIGICRQENCLRKEIGRKQGNTTGMRAHLRKHHPHIYEEALRKAQARMDGSKLLSQKIMESNYLQFPLESNPLEVNLSQDAPPLILNPSPFPVEIITVTPSSSVIENEIFEDEEVAWKQPRMELSKFIDDIVASTSSTSTNNTIHCDSKTDDSTMMQQHQQQLPFHSGLIHNYQTLIAKSHGCLAEMNYSQLNFQDASIIEYHIAIITENLNKLLQQIAISSKSSFAMVNSDAGNRTKTSLLDALNILNRYKEAYESRCNKARKMVNEIPMFDGNKNNYSSNSLNWNEFWAQFKYFIGDSPLPLIEKFHILSKHLDGKAKTLIAHLNFENESYLQAVDLLMANFGNGSSSS